MPLELRRLLLIARGIFIIPIQIPSVSWDDVGGMEETKQVVKESIAASLKGKARKLKRSGVILYGPPGCGKTLIAKGKKPVS